MSHADPLRQLLQRESFPPEAFSLAQAFGTRPLIVYGAGECSHWFFEIVLKMHGYRPTAILDRRFRLGDAVDGIPAFAPEDFHPSPEQQRQAVVILCVGTQAHHEEMARNARAMGFQHVISLRDVYEVHNPFQLPLALRERGFAYYRHSEAAILSAYELFADDLSREIYVKCLETHLTRRPVTLPMRPRPEQYFPTDVPLARGHARFVCCGAYDGDTIRLLQATMGKVETIACFEPEPLIFQRLVTYLQAHKLELADTILALPCAVHSHDGQARFLSGTGLGSRISEQGDAWVQCLTLDHAFPALDPTFICMDVEGVELEVLKGGERLLREHRPDLGVCVYHSPNHLWEIPHFLHDLDLGYRLYLRNYTTYTSETVLYATT